MSVEVPIDQLFADLSKWGPGFLATVGDDDRARFVSIRPSVTELGGERALHFADVGRTACTNVRERPNVSIAFAPHPASRGFSLIVDGIATLDGAVEGAVIVRPSWAVLHRPAP